MVDLTRAKKGDKFEARDGEVWEYVSCGRWGPFRHRLNLGIAIYDFSDTGMWAGASPSRYDLVRALPPEPTQREKGVEASILSELTLPVVATLYVSRGCATARVFSEVAAGPDEYSNLVRVSDVATALEPLRAMLAAAPTPSAAKPTEPSQCEESIRLYDSKALMADGEVHMTAAENVLAWLLVEKIGVPDDVGYSPDDACKTIASRLDLAKEAEDIDAMLREGQGDDDGAQIMPDFSDGMSIYAKVEACLHLLEVRRDVIDAYHPPAAKPNAIASLACRELIDGDELQPPRKPDAVEEAVRAEREACAKVAEDHGNITSRNIARAIRARLPIEASER